jgi:vanillate O-demethylase ferredoxin subunit
LRLRASRIAAETPDIRLVEFVEPSGADLPPFTAGAHVDLYLADGVVRQYSLCNDPAERHRYTVGVLREKSSRGGSRAVHALREGDLIDVSLPRNNFPLAGPEARVHLLLAGGIGVTPMIAMIAELQARRAAFRMHYCTRAPEHTAFLAQLRPLIESGHVVLHHDGGDPSRGLDLKRTLATHEPGTHVYICGPAGFIAAAQQASGAWPSDCVHVEHFSAVALTEDEAAWDARPFKVKIASTGQVYDVPAGRSIVEVLRAAGVPVETSCEDGFCGTCLTRYVEGEPVHRDAVLGESERKNFVMICRARSRSPLLVLDL